MLRSKANPLRLVERAEAGSTSLVVLAVAPDSLASTGWAPLDVAARDVKLAGYRRAVVTRARFSAPVVGLAAVGDTRECAPTDGVGRYLLGGFETLRPVRKDSPTSEEDSLVVSHLAPPNGLRLTCGRARNTMPRRRTAA